MLLITVTLMVIAGAYASARIWSDQGVLLQSTAARIADQIDQALAERWQDINKISELQLFRGDQGRSAEQRRRLNTLVETFKEYAWIGFTNADGEVLVASNGLLEGANVSHRPWWAAARERAFIGDVHPALLLQEKLRPNADEPLRFVDIAAPVRSQSGAVNGVIGAHLYTTWVSHLVEAVIAPLTAGTSLDVLVLNDDGQVIVNTSEHDATARTITSMAHAMTNRQGHVREVWFDNSDGLTGYATARGFRDFPSLGWRVLVHSPRSAVVAPVRQLQWRMAVASLVVVLAVFALGVLLLRGVTRPMRELADAVQAAQSVRDLEQVSVRGGFREVDTLVTGLEDLAERVRTSEAQLSVQQAKGREQADQIQALQHSVVTDPLTGALNRRGMENRIRRLNDSLQSYPRPVTVILFDLDHFKAINDKFGHAAGDAALKHVAQAVQSTLRPTDVFARIGGEEFVVIMLEAPPARGSELAERLRQLIADSAFEFEGRMVTLTASLGVAAAVPNHAGGLDRLIRDADARCYEAKQAGRNCVIAGELAA